MKWVDFEWNAFKGQLVKIWRERPEKIRDLKWVMTKIVNLQLLLTNFE